MVRLLVTQKSVEHEEFYFFSEDRFISFKAGLGNGSNNYTELLSLKLLLKLALDNQISKLQVFGDSQLVINWVNGLYRMHKLLLSPLLFEVIRFTEMLDSVVFKHYYRKMNSVADGFAKAGSLVWEGAWHVMKHWNSEFSKSLSTLKKMFW